MTQQCPLMFVSMALVGILASGVSANCDWMLDRDSQCESCCQKEVGLGGTIISENLRVTHRLRCVCANEKLDKDANCQNVIYSPVSCNKCCIKMGGNGGKIGSGIGRDRNFPNRVAEQDKCICN